MVGDVNASDQWRARIRRGLPPMLLVLAGIVVLALAGASTTLNAIALLLLGLACVWAVALAFFEVGSGEDRDRAAGRDGGPYDRR